MSDATKTSLWSRLYNGETPFDFVGPFKRWLLISFVAPSLGVPWKDAVLGVLCVAGMLWLVSWSYERFAGKVGLGMGDVKLIAMLASFLGLEAALGILVLGSLVGILYGVAMIAWLRTGRATRIPFGPALALAGLAFLFQPDLLERVLGPR